MELRWSWPSHKQFTDGGVLSVASWVFERLGMLALFVILTSTKQQMLQPNLPRWQARKTRRGEKSTRSSKMERRIINNQKKTNPHALPSSNLHFRQKLRNRTWSLWTFPDSERRTSRTRRISPPQSLARSETPPLRSLLVAELAWSRWDRGLRIANMTVTTLANTLLALRPKLTREKGRIHPGKRDAESGTNLDYSFGFQHVVVSLSFLVNFLVILGFSITIFIRIQHYFSFF